MKRIKLAKTLKQFKETLISIRKDLLHLSWIKEGNKKKRRKTALSSRSKMKRGKSISSTSGSIATTGSGTRALCRLAP